MRALLTAALLFSTTTTVFAQSPEDPSPPYAATEPARRAQNSAETQKLTDALKPSSESTFTVDVLPDGQLVVRGSKETVEAYQRELQALFAKTEIGTYSLRHIAAEEAAKLLGLMKIEGIEGIVCNPKSNSIIVKANAGGVTQLEQLLQHIDVPEPNPTLESLPKDEEDSPPRIKVFRLQYLSAVEAAEMLRQLQFTNLEVDAKTNSVIHRANESDIIQSMKLLELLDTNSPAPAENAPEAEGFYEIARTVDLQTMYEQSERKATQLALQLREARDGNDSERVDSLSASLRKAVEQAFKLRIQIQQTELDEAEAALQASRDRLNRRQQIADAIVTRRIKELEKGDDTSWLGK